MKTVKVKNQKLQAVFDWMHGWRTVVVIIGAVGLLLIVMRYYYSL